MVFLRLFLHKNNVYKFQFDLDLGNMLEYRLQSSEYL